MHTLTNNNRHPPFPLTHTCPLLSCKQAYLPIKKRTIMLQWHQPSATVQRQHSHKVTWDLEGARHFARKLPLSPRSLSSPLPTVQRGALRTFQILGKQEIPSLPPRQNSRIPKLLHNGNIKSTKHLQKENRKARLHS